MAAESSAKVRLSLYIKKGATPFLFHSLSIRLFSTCNVLTHHLDGYRTLAMSSLSQRHRRIENRLIHIQAKRPSQSPREEDDFFSSLFK